MHRLRFYLYTITFLPILRWQGNRVRSKTLRLPPPIGDRKGYLQGHQKNNFRLLVLGDSAAEGVGVTAQNDALLGQLVNELHTGLNTASISFQLIAETGHTLTDILVHLKQHIKNNDVLLNADLVVISAGVNDVTTLTKLNQWKRQTDELIDTLQNKLHAQHIIFTAIPPIQHFPAMPYPLSVWLGLRATMLNDILKKRCDHYHSVDLLTLNLTFNPVYMAKDGFHPSAQTYQTWASACVATYLQQKNP